MASLDEFAENPLEAKVVAPFHLLWVPSISSMS
jgi:hypothetical protein